MDLKKKPREILAIRDEPEQEKPKPIDNRLRYSCEVNKKWVPEIIDGSYDGRSFVGELGFVMTDIVVDGVEKYRYRTVEHGWTPYYTGADKTLHEKGTIIAIEIVDQNIIIGAHVKGGIWLDSVNGSELEGDKFIGCMVPLDAFWIHKK